MVWWPGEGRDDGAPCNFEPGAPVFYGAHPTVDRRLEDNPCHLRRAIF